MGTATFILSLDCEGKWGYADQLEGSAVQNYTSAALEEAHRRIVQLLDQYEVPATFAFSSCLFLTPDEVRANPQWFEPSDYDGGDWFRAFRSDAANDDFEGWLCPGGLEAVISSGAHEVASHGFSHIPLGESHITAAQFQREMECIRGAEALRGVKSETFIFPRNQIGYLSALYDHGFIGYRPGIPGEWAQSPKAKLARLVNEFNIFERPQDHATHGRPLAVPPGRMLMLRSAWRRWIPPRAVEIKYARVLDQAIRSGQVLHLFAHPNNFITGKRQYEVLEGVLRAVAQRVRTGEITVSTQQEYCAWLDVQPAPKMPPIKTGLVPA
ncbi:MAG: polysaccharide deacetylase family protein [Proteobacteria bacterium]|nr:polysaccharide deacetylase family protein [Pseudomonadota bacterium]